ncbi:MAG: SAP domain-containing protein, partial [Candidatus Thermoplasmatota archaeon]|nr:SAP domain-containing protein [Candidatus Thermoplasmatota archaeon]
VMTLPYRAGFGSSLLALFMFLIVAGVVWGGLVFTLREMFSEEDEDNDQTEIVEKSMEKSRPSRDYGAMTVAQLRTELSENGLPTSGTKAVLIDRLKGV